MVICSLQHLFQEINKLYAQKKTENLKERERKNERENI